MKPIALGCFIVLFLVTESVADIQLMKVPQSKGELNFLCLTTSNEQDGDVEFISRNLTVCKVWTKTGEATLRNISVGENHFCKSLFHNTSLKGMLSQYTIVQPTSNSEGDWTCEFRNNAMIERSKVVQVKNINKENGDPVADVQLKEAQSRGDLVFLCLATADQKGDVQFKLRDETVCNVRTPEGTRNDVQFGKDHVCERLINDKPNNRRLNIMLSRLRIVQPTSNSEGDWTCELHINDTMIGKSKAVQVKNISKENGGNILDGHGGSANCTPSSVGLFFGGMIMAFVICFILLCILKRTNGLTVGKSKLLWLEVRNVEGSNDGADENLNPEETDAAEPDDK